MKKSLLLVFLVTMLWNHPALAIEAADHDAFFLSGGTANITVKNSDDLISGTTLAGGYRLGLFSILFIEVGYGNVAYAKTVNIDGVLKDVSFRTTGANAGAGFVLPIRKTRLGFKYVRNPKNKWVEEVVDQETNVSESNISGDIDFTTRMLFGQFQEGIFEIGIRQDEIRETDSVLDTSMGVYAMINIKLK